MRMLLDTHTFVWFIEDNPRLPPMIRALIEDPSNVVLVSIVSVWEIAIKVGIGKLVLSQPFETFIPQQLALNYAALLSVDLRHVLVVAGLPFYHRDPFDRLIIAQAMVEGLPILSADKVFDLYAVSRLW
jgi:PIN domain nuclease of toxin-antitoxin system